MRPLFALLVFAAPVAYAQSTPKAAVVAVTMTDVWSEPAVSSSTLTDDKRETQVLSGERVLIHESSGPWARIEAIEQPEFTHNQKWEGYPGWVRMDALRPGAVRSSHPSGKRSTADSILKHASEFIGVPYLWGGLSKAGIDCSGLVHLSFRTRGLVVPRDSHEKWMKCKSVMREGLRPGDLIFSAKADNPKKVTHVVFYAGDEQIVEAPQTGMTVRKVSFKEKYGADLVSVRSGERVGDRVVYFGRLLP
jgi:gamma-D-glutamyl-L-lysine dipeptidyl-peptidase